MKSPKTTIVAILFIVAGVAKAAASLLNGDGMPGMDDIMLVLTGTGFLMSRDNDRTDSESGASVAEAGRELKRVSKANTTGRHGPLR